MTPGLLSIVIPNWNGQRFLKTCLDSLLCQTHAPLEIIVVDNASSDGSQAFVRQHYPQVKLVELPNNRGFTGACNVGIEAAQGEFIVLLNNDTEVDPRWAEAVVRAFGADERVGIVASKMLLFEQRDRIHTAGDGFSTDGRAINRGVWQKDVGQYDREEYVFSACGGSSAYRRAMLDEIGLLDDDFFFLLEDVDLGWRAQLAGWRALYTPQAIVYHYLSATGGGATASFYDGRNAIFVLVKNLPTALWHKHWRAILRHQAHLAWEALRAWRGQAARARLRGMAAALWHLPRLLAKRRAIQARRRADLETLEALLTPIDASGSR
ncbi:MAG: glycosyltransferase family 2 protein [Anaerolineae bacterium]|nr:glycosyltransferase family 2 protein [Anaerolineae bacterium]MDW8173661.1 glycosyltransferase family 2 protein [Anaerolineae bacterium]